LILVLGALALSACSAAAPDDGSGVTTIEVWAHDGTDAEKRVLEEQVAAFDEAREDVEVRLRVVPEGDYNDTLQAAVASGDLPDVAEVDGPFLAGYVYQDALVPLDGLLPDQVLADQLPSLRAQGTVGDRTYAVAAFDSGLGLYADRRALRRAGVDVPDSTAQAWTGAEFRSVLDALARRDPDGKVLDVKLNYGVGEWLTYGFAPLVASAGGRLVDPSTLSPLGHLDGPAARQALAEVRTWSPYVDPDEDDAAFTTRRAPLSWVGHWEYRRYAEALGDDLLVLSLPDLGHGAKTGQGSWTWTVTASEARRREAAAALLEHLVADAQVLQMTEANAAVPGNTTALGRSALYSSGGPLRLFADQLLRTCGDGAPTSRCVAVPRPVTPGYAVLSSRFAQAVDVAWRGEDPDPALRSAAEFVQRDLEDNNGFR
jgi:multiple sugar transport system substrate-binding protein